MPCKEEEDFSQVETQLLIANKVGYIKDDTYQELLNDLIEIEPTEQRAESRACSNYPESRRRKTKVNRRSSESRTELAPVMPSRDGGRRSQRQIAGLIRSIR